MPRVPKVATEATDAKEEEHGIAIFGGSKAYRERYRAEYEAGLKHIADGYPGICLAQVRAAMAGNPLAAKWCAEQIGFGERHEVDAPATTQILQLVLGNTSASGKQLPASIPAEWRVLPPDEPVTYHKSSSAKYDEGDNASS